MINQTTKTPGTPAMRLMEPNIVYAVPMSPPHVTNIYRAVVEKCKEVRGTTALLASEVTASSIIVLRGIFSSREFSVVLSHIIGPEETITAVFHDNIKPIGQNSRTRHYQPAVYLGKDANGASNSRHYQLDVTRRDEANIARDIFHFLKDGVLPK
jgi:hypothetical protein